LAARKSFFISQPFENPLRCVALLFVHAPVVFKDLVDPRHKRTKLLRSWPLTPPIARRNRKLEHLRDRVPDERQSASPPPGGSARPPSPRVVFRHRVPL